jgi:hypothetical protein
VDATRLKGRFRATLEQALPSSGPTTPAAWPLFLGFESYRVVRIKTGRPSLPSAQLLPRSASLSIGPGWAPRCGCHDGHPLKNVRASLSSAQRGAWRTNAGNWVERGHRGLCPRRSDGGAVLRRASTHRRLRARLRPDTTRRMRAAAEPRDSGARILVARSAGRAVHVQSWLCSVFQNVTCLSPPAAIEFRQLKIGRAIQSHEPGLLPWLFSEGACSWIYHKQSRQHTSFFVHA